MFQKLSILPALLFLFLASVAGAADAQPSTMPDALGAYVSVRQFTDFVGKLDAAVAGATRDTSQAVPAGQIEELVADEFPAPAASWNSAGEFRLFADRSFEKVAMTLAVKSFEDFLKGCEEAGMDVEETDPEDEAAAARIFNPNSSQFLYAVDLADGTVALSSYDDGIATLILPTRDWKPQDAAGVDIYMAFDVAFALAQNLDLAEILDAYDGEKEQGVDELVELGLDRAVVGALAGQLRNAIKAGGDELLKMDSVVVKGTFEDDFLRLVVACGSRPDSLLAELGGYWAKQDAVPFDLAKTVSPGPLQLVVSAPMANLLPDAHDRLAALTRTVVGAAFPDQNEAFDKALRAYWDEIPGEFVQARYIARFGVYDLYVTRARNAAACVEKLARLAEVANAMLDRAIADKSLTGKLATERLEKDGLASVRIQPELDDPELAAALAEALQSAYPGAKLDAGLPALIRFYAAAKGDLLIVVCGSGLEDADLPRLAAMLDDGESMLAESGYAKTLGRLAATQAAAGVVDLDQAFRLFAQQLAATQLRGGYEHLAGAFARAAASLPRSGMSMGVGMGADAGRPACEFVFSPDAVNAVIKHYDGYMQAVIAEIIRESEMDEEEEEEVVLDEDPELSLIGE